MNRHNFKMVIVLFSPESQILSKIDVNTATGGQYLEPF